MAKIDSRQILRVQGEFSVERDHLVNTKSIAAGKWIEPFDDPTIPVKLASLKEEDTNALIDFAKNYGVLGYREIATRGVDFEERKRILESTPGDPLVWVWSHVATVNMALDLISSLKKKTKELGLFLKGLTDDTGTIHFASATRPATPFHWGQNIQTPEHAAGVLLESILRHNLSDLLSVEWQSLLRDDNALRLFKAVALLPVIYAHIGAAWEGQSIYFRCSYRNCKKWNADIEVRSGPRRRYCPNERGRDSLCYRMEDYHKRKLGNNKQ